MKEKFIFTNTETNLPCTFIEPTQILGRITVQTADADAIFTTMAQLKRYTTKAQFMDCASSEILREAKTKLSSRYKLLPE